MAKYSQQKNIKVVFVAEGTTCRYSTQEAGGDAAKEALRVRTKSSTDSLELLGVRDVEFYNLPCGRLDLEPILEINQIIENEINEFQPELILTHSENDVNNDHRIVYRSVQMATRPGSLCRVDKIMSFEVLSSKGYFRVISFHSLEDRLVKRFFRSRSNMKARASRHLPEKSEDTEIAQTFYLADKRGICAGKEETHNNPRSRSARMRWAERTEVSIRH